MNENKVIIKRSLQTHLFGFATLLFIGLPLLRMAETAFLINSCILILFSFMFFRRLFLNKYITLENDVVTIFNDFRIIEMRRDEIVKIQIVASPFGKSYFELVDGEKVKFEGWSISNKDLPKLKEICNNVV